ncbi:hypothetical protein EV183_001213 [Coemansia sp. RSA 2336]|nr:hypothetical protein EV183_001213 [Coemansia sp. RSA 2336]
MHEYAEQQIRMHHENPVPAEQRELFNWTTDRKPAAKEHRTDIDAGHGDRGAASTSGAISVNTASQSKFNIMEVGCGAGNAVFPILADIADPRLFVYACDYSQVAVDVVKASKAYDQQRCTAFVWDLASTELPPDVQPESIDIMLMIFVFSALHPKQWRQAVENAYRLLKPGGILLFRDYGRNDLAQVRFKKSRLLEDNLYIRGDGTRVYFFTNDELAEIFGAKFEIEQNAIDRRLLVNRKRELKIPWVILNDAGGAFAMGAIGGGTWHFIKGARNSPYGERFRGGMNAMRSRGPIIGGNFAVWGSMFSTFECVLKGIRQKEDPWNSIGSGAITGGLLAARGGWKAASVSAVFGGVLLALIEGVGITMSRAFAQQPPVIAPPPSQ